MGFTGSISAGRKVQMILAAGLLVVVGVLVVHKQLEKQRRHEAVLQELKTELKRTRVDISRSSGQWSVDAQISAAYASRSSKHHRASLIRTAEMPQTDADGRSREGAYPVEVTFNQAANEYGVPAELLKAIAYVQGQGESVRPGEVGSGVMRLGANSEANNLKEAAELVKADKEKLQKTPSENIRAATALLRSYHDKALEGGSGSAAPPWFTAVMLYSGRSPDEALSFTREVEQVLQNGVNRTTSFGQKFEITPGQQELIAGPQDSEAAKAIAETPAGPAGVYPPPSALENSVPYAPPPGQETVW